MRHNFIFQKLLLAFLLLITFWFTFSSAAEEYRYHCPLGVAKKDQTGNFVQCLPGDYSTHTCGEKHFCFFSGFNYVCCPEGKNNKVETVHINDFECPSNSFVQLDGIGQMMECNKNTDCIGLNSQCHKGFCCSASKKIQPTNYRVTPRKKEKKVIQVDLSKLDCPHPFLTVLNDESLPTVCDKSKPCSSSSEQCVSVGKVSICCENLGSASEVEDEEESGETEPNIIKIYDSTNDENIMESKDNNKNTLDKTKKIESTTMSIDKKSTTIKIETKKDNNKETLSLIDITTSTPKKSKLVSNTVTVPLTPMITNEPLVKYDEKELEPLPTIRSKIHSSGPTKTAYDAVKLEPHFMGGYQKVGQEEEKNNKRAIVQKFLMDQIKKGWPYEDQFYWPEGYDEQSLINKVE